MSNTVTVIGNLARDPELRYTPQGLPVVTLSVADTPRNLDKASGQWVDGVTDWVKVVAWRGLAENVGRSLKKGDRIIVIGHYETEKYTDKNTNEEKTSRKLVADEVSPSLLYAVATVEKVRNNTGGNNQGNGGGYQPNANTQANTGGGAIQEEMPF